MKKPHSKKVLIKNLFNLSHPKSLEQSLSNEGETDSKNSKVQIPTFKSWESTPSAPASTPLPASSQSTQSTATPTHPRTLTDTERAQLKADLKAEVEKEAKAALKKELDAQRQSALTELNAELAQLKSQCDLECQSLRENAQTQGHQAGLKAATDEAEDKIKSRYDELLTNIQRLQDEKKKIIENAEADILNFGIRVAELLTRTTLTQHRDAYRNLILAALKKTTDKNKVIIRIGEHDLEYVQENLDYFQNKLKDIKTIEVLQDDRIQQGGCIIETRLGYIDISLATQMESLKETIRQTNKDLHRDDLNAIIEDTHYADDHEDALENNEELTDKNADTTTQIKSKNNDNQDNLLKAETKTQHEINLEVLSEEAVLTNLETTLTTKESTASRPKAATKKSTRSTQKPKAVLKAKPAADSNKKSKPKTKPKSKPAATLSATTKTAKKAATKTPSKSTPTSPIKLKKSPAAAKTQKAKPSKTQKTAPTPQKLAPNNAKKRPSTAKKPA